MNRCDSDASFVLYGDSSVVPIAERGRAGQVAVLRSEAGVRATSTRRGAARVVDSPPGTVLLCRRTPCVGRSPASAMPEVPRRVSSAPLRHRFTRQPPALVPSDAAFPIRSRQTPVPRRATSSVRGRAVVRPPCRAGSRGRAGRELCVQSTRSMVFVVRVACSEDAIEA